MSVGLEPDLSSDEVFISRFPVHRACRDGDVGALASLLEQLSNQAHLTAEDSCYGWTPLHWAAHYGQLECVVRLVQMGCGVNTGTSRFNQTPTHIAAFGGHHDCVVWLTQSGADVNRQDFVGEAPIHKAARSGSLECVQVLLIAGAQPHLRNANGQTAADLARTNGFLGCSRLICDDQKHQLQPSGLHDNRGQNGNPPLAPALLSRKRLLAALDSGNTKRARGAEIYPRDVSMQLPLPVSPAANVLVQMHSSGDEDVESMNMESGRDLSSDDDTKAITNGHHHMPPCSDQEPPRSPTSPPPNQASRHSSADMCGSLHLAGSPSSCVSHRPAWWGPIGADCGGFLHYGHYHGFGDTAEELGNSGCSEYSSIQAKHRYQ